MTGEIVENDLLALLQQKQVDLTDKTCAIKFLTDKFSDSEIDVSKRLLYSVLKKSNHMVARRRDEAKENAQDIVTLFKNTAPGDMPTFVTKELLQLDVQKLLKDIELLKANVVKEHPPATNDSNQPATTLVKPEEVRDRKNNMERKAELDEVPIVTVEQGQLQGRVILGDKYTDKHFYSFQGVPYAKPPLGSLRFKAPQPPEPWEGIRTATSEGNMTPQIDLVFSKAYAGNEDCLFLNVYTPTLKGATLPVMIFIHGGGFSFGTGSSDLYGADYLTDKGVVVVTLNYRCGALGFLSLNTPEVPGNAGMKDIVQAIRWVKSNIQNFGGNADNITIFGESAGGAAVCYLTVSPLTKKLVHKAIVQSGTALGGFALQKTPIENASTLAKILGYDSSDSEGILQFLQTRSAEEIIDAQQKMNPPEKFLGKLSNFSIVIEKEFPGVEALITESFYDLLTSGKVADIPIMIGVCSLEYDVDLQLDDLQLFIPEEFNLERDSAESLEIVEKIKELYYKNDNPDGSSELLSDHIIKVDTNRVVRHLAQATKNRIYYYNFDYVGGLNISSKVFQEKQRRAGHMDDLGYLFKNVFQTDSVISPEDLRMREKMTILWTNFAKCGRPTLIENNSQKETWLPVTTDNQYYLNIGSELTLQRDINKEKMDFWNNLYRKYLTIGEKPKAETDDFIGNNAAGDIPDSSNQLIVRANDPPEDDLPKNIGVNKFISFFDSLGGRRK